ncbi:MAG: ATP phosphoribosyltransferase regulatory subunit [Alphaproteobacteria bacterium]|nr:ATP phosphoribosyltransferase regulatory subunit [Alphaproteobacteria bacterium]
MDKNNTELALLPSGFADLLPPDAEEEARAITLLMKHFAAFGYHRVKPPLLEFEDSLLAPGPGARMAPDTFRLMDPVSHRMLGLRPDITPQIARIASSRLCKEPRPLRLTYASDVLRTRASQLRTRRQFCQVGCEIIGDGTIDTDVEICMLALIGLKDLGLKNITLDLNIPGFAARLTDGKMTEDMKSAIRQRNQDALAASDIPAAKTIAKAMQAAGPAKTALPALQKLELPEALTKDIDILSQLCSQLEAAINDLALTGISLTIDILDQDGFEYHKGLGFTLFSPHIGGELGRGGCYEVQFGESDPPETARGFTLYMDTIGKAATPPSAPPKLLAVPSSEKWTTLQDLQNQGWTILRGAPDHNCTHRYDSGKITPIE